MTIVRAPPHTQSTTQIHSQKPRKPCTKCRQGIFSAPKRLKLLRSSFYSLRGAKTLLTCSRNWEQKQMCTYLALITQISISTEGPQATAVKGSKSLIPWNFTWLSSLSQLSWPIAETCISKRCAGWTRWSSRNICPTQMLRSRSHLTSIPGAELTKPDQKTKWHFNASGFDHLQQVLLPVAGKHQVWHDLWHTTFSTGSQMQRVKQPIWQILPPNPSKGRLSVQRKTQTVECGVQTTCKQSEHDRTAYDFICDVPLCCAQHLWALIWEIGIRFSWASAIPEVGMKSGWLGVEQLWKGLTSGRRMERRWHK